MKTMNAIKKIRLFPLLMCILLATALLAACGEEQPSNGNTGSTGESTTGTAPAEPTPPPADPTEAPAPTDPTEAPTDGNGTPDPTTPAGGGGDTEATLKSILGTVGETFELPMLMYTHLANDMEYGENGVAYFIGTHDVPFKDGVVAEAAIGAIPFSVALIQVEPNTDIDNAKTLMKDGIDPAKWICVRADVVIVDSLGELIILILSSDEHSPGLGEAIQTAFLEMEN